MAIRERAVERDRERFLSDSSAPRSVRPEIAVSWRRCSFLDVPAERLSPRYAPDIDPDGPLLRAALPVIDHVNERLGDVGISFLLTDPSARIIDRRSSNIQLLDRLDTVSAATGFIFAEDEVGTNGVGTAIELRRPVRVDGHEHYVEELRQFTCIGIPIFGADKRLHGLLDVSCVADHHNTVINFIAEQTAEKIEQRLLAQQSAAERALLDRFLAASRRGRADFFVISDRVLISSPRAARLLDGAEQALVWEHIARLLDRSDAGKAELELPGGRQVLVRTEELRDGSESIGAMVEIREAAVPASSAPDAHARRMSPLPGLIGSDAAWLGACSEVATAAAHDIVAVCGEPGVGKTAVAVAAHEQLGGGPLVVRDAATMAVDGPSWWLERLRSSMDGPPGSIVVRHLHGLSPAAAGSVMALLRAARLNGWRCFTTFRASAAETPAGLPGEQAVVVELPPLRHRLDDVPALARFFASPRRVAPEVVSLFLRLPWPGNISALQAAIVQATSGPAEIRLADVPRDVRAGAFRRRMSRFEHAELSAIMDALAEARGNKKAAAALLGISRSTLYRKLEAAGLEHA